VIRIEPMAEASPLLFAVESRREFLGKKLPMDGCGRLQGLPVRGASGLDERRTRAAI